MCTYIYVCVRCVRIRYRYLINSASIGYANKFKYLLLCGSVVIYVQEGVSQVNKSMFVCVHAGGGITSEQIDVCVCSHDRCVCVCTGGDAE